MKNKDFTFQFKTKISDVNQRRKMSEKIKQMHPDKIPIICEKDPLSKMGNLDKTKYVVHRDITVAQFVSDLGKKVEIPPSEAIFLLVNAKHTISGNTRLGDIYETYANKEDGFLYIVCASKEIWGAL